MIHYRPMHTNSKEGLELFNYLKEKLNLPANIVEFSVNLKLNDLVTVDCTYYPTVEVKKEND